LKGIIFNVFEQRVARDRGEAAWDRVLEDADLEGTYTWGEDRCILEISCSR
jgi:hypothetical protein